jgi:hypothetical protein
MIIIFKVIACRKQAQIHEDDDSVTKSLLSEDELAGQEAEKLRTLPDLSVLSRSSFEGNDPVYTLN